MSVQAPGLGVTARIRRSTTAAGKSHRTRAFATVIFGATLTPSAGCGRGVSR
ncbi:Uncharacterised protein [Mycobacterium tuberculosis]|uniref:Uncharacterized protein n=1 Tax=Mycobacterium tuberculosis TaxID=1773 RepID=A0A0T9YU96_MYCTX|nr:hypothetical protein CAB90_01593 [Mycobacterium tuberculosis]CFR97819.1 Uncharacterised protein [Mycobacterium tuberculosis]CKS41398.1 Uncharacterised protein [Mycobacterium tuberculosis]CKS94862.1 Uncharacterised protein [Mycobacterium tuberculosis]CNM08793.1 Uncharacterised protein [Mycobacterium tuberculosis]